MNRNFVFIALLFFISITASAQNFKMGPPTFFPDVWGAGRELIKTISDGVLSRQKIQEEAQKRDFGIAGLLGQKKSYSETIRERRQGIKAVRQEILEAKRNLQPTGSKSSQELESELFYLLALGSLPEEEKGKSLMVVPEEGEKPLLLPKPVQSQGWQVPGMKMASKLGPGSGFSGSIDSAASLFLSVLAVNKSLPLRWLENQKNPALALNLKLPPNVLLEPPPAAIQTRKVVRVHLKERVTNQSTLVREMNRWKPQTQFSIPIPLAPKSPPSALKPRLKIQNTPAAFLELKDIPPPPEPLLPKKKKGSEADTEKTPIKMSLKEDVLVVSLERFYLLNTRLVALDTEATGLGNDHRLTEIGCVEIQKGIVTGHKFQTYLNPEREVDRSAHILTGYTWQFLKKYPLFQATAAQFLRFIQGAVLVIHTAHYDLKLINEALAACHNSYGKLEEKHAIIDTAVLARNLYPGKSYSLTAVCAHNGISTTRRQKHGALIDAELLAEVFQAMTCNSIVQFFYIDTVTA